MVLTTGQLATAADVNIQTVRYYERRGLVPAPRRMASGYRQYPDSVVKRTASSNARKASASP